jgi:hypothetical protein
MGGYHDSMLKKMMIIAIAVTVSFSIYVVWLKWDADCVPCGAAATGLPVSQLTLAILALIGSLCLAFCYYLSLRLEKFQRMCVIIMGFFAVVASFLMTLQIQHSICVPCLITDILFYLVFALMCLNFFTRPNKNIKEAKK